MSDPKKPKMTLLPFNALEYCARVQEFGNSKPGRTPLDWASRPAQDLVDAALRHIGKDQYVLGISDEESGLMHLAHAAQSLLLALAIMVEEREYAAATVALRATIPITVDPDGPHPVDAVDPAEELTREAERLGMYQQEPAKLKLSLDDPHSRAVWQAVQRANAEVAAWPAWKRGESTETPHPGREEDDDVPF